MLTSLPRSAPGARGLDAALYRQYLTTNAHILDGKNPHIKFKKVGFTVSTPTLEEAMPRPCNTTSTSAISSR
jgi:hypothetical protein